MQRAALSALVSHYSGFLNIYLTLFIHKQTFLHISIYTITLNYKVETYGTLTSLLGIENTVSFEEGKRCVIEKS